jgi:hypothetical protein
MKNTIKQKSIIKMAAIRRMAGITALVAVIVFTAACSTTGTTAEPGTLTITGLGNFAGNYICARVGGDKDNIVAAADIGTESSYGQGYPVTGGLIENGSITLPVWEITSEGEPYEDYTHEKTLYTGNDTLTLYINIWDDGPAFFTELGHHFNNIAFCTITVTFNNGSANIAFVADEESE